MKNYDNMINHTNIILIGTLVATFNYRPFFKRPDILLCSLFHAYSYAVSYEITFLYIVYKTITFSAAQPFLIEKVSAHVVKNLVELFFCLVDFPHED
jgi:hypothetical protein